MNEKPLWEALHDGWMDDVKFDIKQIMFFSGMLVRDPHGRSSDNIRSIIKNLEKNLENTCKEYKKIYGVRPNVRRIKQEVENDQERMARKTRV